MGRETKEIIAAVCGPVLLVYVICGVVFDFVLATIGTVVGVGFVGFCWLWVVLIEKLFNNDNGKKP